MITRRPDPTLFGMCCLLLGLLHSAVPAPAQVTSTLIQFTNVWKYDASGLELGRAWRTNDYSDEAWASGQGLLGFEGQPAPYAVHAPFLTTIVPSTTVTTFYFRTTFDFTGSAAGLKLIASNLVDDGCVFYLNGVEAGSVRRSVSLAYNANTFFSGPALEGQLDTVTLSNLNALVPGVNLLAAEVHQSSAESADVAWGMKLMAFQATPLSIVIQPQSQTVMVGETVTLNVAVAGGPAFYQWQKNGLNIIGATNGSAISGNSSSSYSISQVSLAASGGYRVIITNALGSMTSEVATVTVVEDRVGPRLVSAIINDPAFPLGSNSIRLTFTEPVLSTTTSNGVRTPANYALIPTAAASIRIPITNVLYNVRIQAALFPDINHEYWSPFGSYYLIVNNVADIKGNVIAPNSSIAVLAPHKTNLMSVLKPWSFHAAGWIEPEVYDQNWMSPDFVESSWWALGNGPFAGGTFPDSSCLGIINTETGFQPEPILFRSSFVWPGHWPPSGLLQFVMAFDDGLVLFLNGKEVWRTNVAGGAISPFTGATLAANVCTNLTLSVTNLAAGTNWLAAAVVHYGTIGQGDSAFGLRLDGTVFLGPTIEEDPTPSLSISSVSSSAVRFSWIAGGYALESSTNLEAGGASYPHGPWQQVPAMSNPYTNRLDGPARFFRLTK